MRKFLLLSTFLLYLIIGAYSSASAKEVTVTFTMSDYGYSDAKVVTSENLNDDFSATFTKGGSNDPKYYTSDETLRIYSGGSATITTSNSNYTIKSIVGAKNQTETVKYNFNIEGDGKSGNYKATAKTYFHHFNITYEDGTTSGPEDFDSEHDQFAGLTWNGSSYDLALTVGDIFELTPTTANPPVITYTTSDAAVAEYDSDSKAIYAYKEGTATITGSWDAVVDTWNAGTVTINVTVTKADPNSKYYLVKSLSEFDAAQKCILVAWIKDGSYQAAMGAQGSGDYREAVPYSPIATSLPDQLNATDGTVTFILEPTNDAKAYYIKVGEDKYISVNTGEKTATKEVAKSSNPSTVNLTINESDHKASLKATTGSRALGYNNTTNPKRFASYGANEAQYNQVYLYQQRVEIAKEDALIDWDGIDTGAEVVRELVGDVTFPTLTVDPDKAATAVRYSSSDEAVATIDAVTGEITRKGVGTTTITAKIEGDVKYKNVSDNYVLKIQDSRQVVTVTFNPASAEACIVDADEFEWPVATAYLGEVASEDAKSAVVFSSSNDDVLSIGSDYTDHNLLASGEADIIASIPADNLTYRMEAPAKCHIKVVRGDVTLAFDATTATADMFVNFTEPTLSVTPNDETVKSNITYTSSDKSVADVNATTGEVTTYKAGETVIKATFAGSALYNPAEASYTLTVRDERVTPTLTWSCGESMEYAMGSEIAFESPTITVTGEGIDADAVKALLTYESSNENVATVDTEGVVEVIGEGTAVITAKVPNGNATYAPTSATFTLTVGNIAADKYNLISIGETFEDGDLIIIGDESKMKFVSKVRNTGNDRVVESLDEAAGSTITPTESDNYLIFKLEEVTLSDGVEGTKYFRLHTTNYGNGTTNNGYATCVNNDNAFKIETTATNNYSIFTITYKEGNIVLTNVGNERWLRYNAGKFRFYDRNLEKGIVIYKKAKATKPSTPEFSMPNGSVLTWQTAGVTVTSANATKVWYRLRGQDSNGQTQYTDWKSVDGDHAVVYIAFNCTIEAYGVNIYGESDFAEATYTVTGTSATIYDYVNSFEQIDLFKKYILVNRDNKVAMGTYNASDKWHTLAEVGVATDGKSVTSQNALKFMFVKVDNNDDPFGGGTTRGDDPSEPASAPARETAQSSGTYYMLLENGNYMKLSTTENETSEVESTSEATKFTIDFPDGNLVLLSDSESGRYLGCNFLSDRFSSYSGGQYKTTYLYREGETLTGVADIVDEAESAEVEWYTLDGMRVKNPAPGIYIRRCGSKVGKYIIK